tara:strand:- start:813 stop:1316 length:504 start_codon:yes stop_codon:yes gene_type:complete
VNSIFNEVWKKQIVQPKGGAKFWKPKSDIKPIKDDEEDRNCCQEVKDFLKKIVGQAESLGFKFGVWQDYWNRHYSGEDNLKEPWVDGNANDFRLMGFDVSQIYIEFLNLATKDEYNCLYLKKMLLPYPHIKELSSNRPEHQEFRSTRLAKHLLEEWDKCLEERGKNV